MPTVIDALVVTLGLDDSDYRDGQRRAEQSLGRLGQTADRQATGISRTTSRSLRDYLGGFDRQFEAINRQLSNMGNQSTRASQQVRASGMHAAEGFSGLAGAALTAYAALKSVQETIKAIGSATTSAVSTGRMAHLTNLPIGWLSRFEQYANVVGSVPHETTQATLNAFVQKQTAYKETGAFSDVFKNLGYLGVNPLGTVDQIVAQLSAVLQTKNGPQAQFWANEAGLGPLIQVLMRGPGALQKGMAAQAGSALDPEQYKNLEELGQAIRAVEESWNHLLDAVLAENPKWKTFLDGFKEWLDYLANTKEGLAKVEIAAGLVSTVIAVTFVAALGKAVNAIYAFNAAWAASPLGRIVSIVAALEALGLVTVPLPHQGQQEQDKELQNAPGPAANNNRPSFWTRMNPANWAIFNGGRPAWEPPPPASPASTPGSWPGITAHARNAAPNDAYFNWASIGGGPATARHYGSPEEGVQAVDQLLRSNTYIGGGTNTLGGIISKWAPPNENDTEALIKRAETSLGVSRSSVIDPSNAEFMRRLVTVMIANEHGGALPRDLSQPQIDRALGFAAPAASDGTRPAPDPRPDGMPRPLAEPQSSVAPRTDSEWLRQNGPFGKPIAWTDKPASKIPTGPEFYGPGSPFGPTPPAEFAAVPSTAAAISTIRSSQVANNNTATTHNYGDIQTGPIQVQSPAGESPYRVGSAVADAIRREAMVNHANQAQE